MILRQENKNQNIHIIYLGTNNLYGYGMTKFLPTNGFKSIYPKEFDLNKYNSNSLKGSWISKRITQLHNDYPLALNKIEIKTEMLSEYQLKIADLYNILSETLKY